MKNIFSLTYDGTLFLSISLYEGNIALNSENDCVAIPHFVYIPESQSGVFCGGCFMYGDTQCTFRSHTTCNRAGIGWKIEANITRHYMRIANWAKMPNKVDVVVQFYPWFKFYFPLF